MNFYVVQILRKMIYYLAMNKKIAPSLLASDPGNYREGVQFAEKIGGDLLHIDVMDGTFVPPITFGDNVVSIAKKSSSLFIETHLMITAPEKHLEAFIKAGSDRIIVHLEATKNLTACLKTLKDANISSGIAINPETSIEKIYEYLEYTDLILVMTVNPGWGGQAFIEDCLEKVKKVKAKITELNLPVLIEVDGGINQETGSRCLKAGVDILVSGSYLYSNEDPSSAVVNLRSN